MFRFLIYSIVYADTVLFLFLARARQQTVRLRVAMRPGRMSAKRRAEASETRKRKTKAVSMMPYIGAMVGMKERLPANKADMGNQLRGVMAVTANQWVRVMAGVGRNRLETNVRAARTLRADPGIGQLQKVCLHRITGCCCGGGI